MKACHRCGWIFDEKLDFCPDCEAENFDTLNPAAIDTTQKTGGAWILMSGTWRKKAVCPPRYTGKAADIIVHKATGKKFTRGEIILYSQIGGKPPLIEEIGEYDFIYRGGSKQK